jgi:MacB-like periplasmic core domain
MTDLRFSLRFLRNSPGFAATAIVTLAVGIAVNTTCLALLNNLAFRLIPAADPEGLVRVYPLDRTGRRISIVSYPDYRELRDRGTELFDLAAYVPTMVTVRNATGSGDLGLPRDVLAYVISANYLSILGARPIVGRTILPQEDQVADTHAVAVISHRIWQRLGGSDDALKTSLIVNGRAFSIIGVMPPDFVGSEPLVPDLGPHLDAGARQSRIGSAPPGRRAMAVAARSSASWIFPRRSRTTVVGRPPRGDEHAFRGVASERHLAAPPVVLHRGSRSSGSCCPHACWWQRCCSSQWLPPMSQT